MLASDLVRGLVVAVIALTVIWYQFGYTHSIVNLLALIAYYRLGLTGDRKREIGILQALGAKQRTIFTIFLLESGFYGVMGGITHDDVTNRSSELMLPLSWINPDIRGWVNNGELNEFFIWDRMYVDDTTRPAQPAWNVGSTRAPACWSPLVAEVRCTPAASPTAWA